MLRVEDRLKTGAAKRARHWPSLIPLPPTRSPTQSPPSSSSSALRLTLPDTIKYKFVFVSD